MRQSQALARMDTDALVELDRQRTELQARLVPLARSGLTGADLQEATALAQLIVRDQEQLIAVAEGVRDRLAHELSGLQPGRAALAAYRAPTLGNSRYLDRVR